MHSAGQALVAGPVIEIMAKRQYANADQRVDAFLQPMIHGQVLEIGDLNVLSFDQIHGQSITSGLRIGDAAYSTDVKELPEESFDILQGVKLWIVDCVGFEEHPTHAHLDLALEWIERVKPERAVLTHMSHQFDYEALKAGLPRGVEPGYDGMRLKL